MSRSLRVTSVGRGSRREQAVDDRDRPDSAHASPLVGNRIVDTQHATLERGLNLPQPSFEGRGFVRIPWTRKLDPLANLPKNERAQNPSGKSMKDCRASAA
jgi:hypothetical protein